MTYTFEEDGMQLPALLRLGQLASAADRSEASVIDALSVVQGEILASKAALAYVTPTGFGVAGNFDQDFAPTTLWLIQRDLTSHSGLRTFDRIGSRVVAFRELGEVDHFDHVSMLLP